MECSALSEMKNFNRQYRLAAGKAGTRGFEIGRTDGVEREPLHISFSIQKSELEPQNTGRVSVWNLNDAHIAALEEQDCVIALRAGYGNRLPLIFSGVISHAVTSMDGSDRVTEIECVDNLVEVRDVFVSVSYFGIVSWEKIFDDVANQMGVAIVYGHNVSFTTVANGFSFIGQARNLISKGCSCCGLSWSIQNGVIQIKKPNDTMTQEVFILSPDTGLIDIPERVCETSDSGETMRGWDVTYLLNGAISISDFVKLETKSASGYFRVYSIEITGDNIGDDWCCKARLLEVG